MKKFLIMFLAIVFILGISIFAHADKSVTLAWDANSEKDLAGYRVFYKEYGTAVFDYATPNWEGTETSCVVVVPGDGQFVARAFDYAGNESGDSNVVTLDEPPETPKTLLIQAVELAIQALEKFKDALARLEGRL